MAPPHSKADTSVHITSDITVVPVKEAGSDSEVSEEDEDRPLTRQPQLLINMEYGGRVELMSETVLGGGDERCADGVWGDGFGSCGLQ